jgi:hypothetical protein
MSTLCLRTSKAAHAYDSAQRQLVQSTIFYDRVTSAELYERPEWKDYLRYHYDTVHFEYRPELLMK